MDFNNSENGESERALIDSSLVELEFPKVRDCISRYCVSSLGQEIIEAMMPTENIAWLRDEHERLQEAYNLYAANEPIPLDNLSDVRTQLQKARIEHAYLQPGELLDVYEVLQGSRRVRNFFKNLAERTPRLTEFTQYLFENRLLEKHITEAIDETGAVRDNASRDLQRIRREIQDTANRLRQRLQKLLKKMGEEDVLTDEFITQRDGRFVMPVRVEHKRTIPGIIHGSSQTGSTVFMEPAETFEMNNELSLLYNEERREIIKILQTLTGEVGAVADEMLGSLEILALLDALQAKSRHAVNFGGMRPEITEENVVEMRNVFHPVLVQNKGLKNVIPLSIEFTDSIRGHLISGPNAGGKTVALKSIGLNLLMALSGIFPLGECRTNYRRIFSGIGDHQSIDANLSTFSSQLHRLREILAHCAPDVLVLVDEIASGTDPAEGGALAAGILDSFLERRVFFIVTTHQSSLKSYALTKSEIKNASLEFDQKRLEPTYKFLSGVPGNSYAFALAENLGIPDVVLKRARGYLGDRHSELEESIAALQRFRSEAEELHKQASEDRRKAEQSRSDYEVRLKDIKQNRNSLLKEARQEALGVVSQANALVEQTIREIKEQQRSASDVKREFEEGKSNLQKEVAKARAEDKAGEETQQIGIGDIVAMEGMTQTGTVIELDKEGNALADFNGLKFRVPVGELRITKQKKKELPRSTEAFIKFDAKTSLDIRGMRAEEAWRDLDRFISDALVGNLDNVTIVHGKGTGALRQVVQDFLAQHPSVTSQRPGELTEGGAGVTVVSLK